MITIIDYDMGNIRSVQNALEYLGVEHCLSCQKQEILSSDKIILPGVGAFNVAMDNLKQRGLVEILKQAVFEHKIPILGICLGMQLLADKGYEGGETNGLGFIRGEVKLIDTLLKLPHIGFNTVNIIEKPNSIFKGLNKAADFYFVHSYALRCEHKEDIACFTEYGSEFVSAVSKKNIFGAQFHPEKSQSNGLLVLKNFIRLDKNVLC